MMKVVQFCLIAYVAVGSILTGCGGGGGSTAPIAPAPTPTPTPTSTPAPTVTLTTDKSSAKFGETVHLSWTSTDAKSCAASGTWTGPQALSGAVDLVPTAAGTASYTLTCTGDGGSGSKSVTVSIAAAIGLPVKANSYLNAKGWGIDQITFPASSQVGGGPLAWGLGDFAQHGAVDLFTANQNYDPSKVSQAAATSNPVYLSDFEFWRRNTDGTLTKISSVKGCLHPRKAVVADFNNDGIPDVFVACHGYDAAPFPGEKSKLLLSDGLGGYKLSDATAEVGFFHGASSADLNGDGFPDIVVADNSKNPNLYALINQKNGTFAVDTTRITSDVAGFTGPYFSVELVDVNNDGITDLIAGGHEQSGTAPTKIFMGTAAGRFGGTAGVTTIPSVPGRGVVLDFTIVTNAGKIGMFVNRTSDETSVEGFYGTRTMQWVDLSNMQSTILLDAKATWVPWWLPVTKNAQNGVQPYNAGTSLFLSK
jgi:hypothetical protein